MTGQDKSKTTKFWMAVSGLSGFMFFLLTNFCTPLHELRVLTGCIQLCINGFVHLTWKNGFRQAKGIFRLIALIGCLIPLCMASITIIRVLLPALVHRL